MSRRIEWIEPRRRVQWLGQLDPISFEQMLPETTNGEDQPPTNGEEQPPTNGEEQPPTNGEKTPTPEQEEKQIQRVERGLSTTEKVVIASLFLQLLTFAWGVYSFQARMRKEEKAA